MIFFLHTHRRPRKKKNGTSISDVCSYAFPAYWYIGKISIGAPRLSDKFMVFKTAKSGCLWKFTPIKEFQLFLFFNYSQLIIASKI